MSILRIYPVEVIGGLVAGPRDRDLVDFFKSHLIELQNKPAGRPTPLPPSGQNDTPEDGPRQMRGATGSSEITSNAGGGGRTASRE